MNQTKFDQEKVLNQRAYEEHREQIRREYAGRYVAIAFGRIITTSEDFDEAVRTVEGLRPRPEHIVVFPAEQEPMFEPFYSTYKEFN